MLTQSSIKFPAVLISSILISSLLSLSPAKSQTATTQPQNLSATQPRKMSSANLIAESIKPSVVRVVLGCQVTAYLPKTGKIYHLETDIAHGSGFFASNHGHIVTNAHVINFTKENCQESLWQELASKLESDGENPNAVAQQLKWMKIEPIYSVILSNGKQLPSQVIISGATVGEGKDVAILKVNLANTPAIPLADSDKVQIADTVTVVGYPAIIDYISWLDKKSLQEASFTKGMVSAHKTLSDGTAVIQINGTATSGNSGGPVINEQGEVIGIVTFGSRHSDNFAFLFTSNTIREFLTQAGITNS
ncbi:S1C family serine protease, partial [Calothrix sp. 336/3]|uniref:S1C family serine protease n=1 Tax=Calothrix sp. 336/3 TaxID=1337936 RepID=UPI000556D687